MCWYFSLNRIYDLICKSFFVENKIIFLFKKYIEHLLWKTFSVASAKIYLDIQCCNLSRLPFDGRNETF